MPSLADYLFGFCGLVVSVAALGAAAVRVRATLFGRLDPALARLVEIVVAVGMLTTMLQLLGAVSAFYRPVVMVAVPIGALVVAAITRRVAAVRHATEPQSRFSTRAALRRPPVRVALALAAIVAVQWVAYAVPSLQHGMQDVDTLRYHAPVAVRFVQQHSVVHLEYTSTQNQEFFFPANSELLNAWTIMLFGRDFLTPLMNLLWLGVALLAAWCAGGRVGRPAVALAGVAVVCATPLMSSLEPGSARNDITAVAWLLATVALLVHALAEDRARVDRRLLALGGIASGLAAGTKLTVLGPVALLWGAFAVAAMRKRGWKHGPRLIAVLAPGAFATGAIWYVRNAVYTGTPLPWFRVPLGPVTLAGPDMPYNDQLGYSVAHYAGSARFWRAFAVPGLIRSFGPLFAVLVIAALVAGIAAATGRGVAPTTRVVGLASLAAFASYLVTPWSAGGPLGTPRFFEVDLRFVVPALVLAAVAAASLRRERAILPALAVGMVVNIVAAEGHWPTRTEYAVLGVAATGVALTVAVVTHRLPMGRRARVAVMLATVAVVAIAGRSLEYDAVTSWYATAGSPRDTAYAMFRTLHDADVAVAGFADDYPFFGRSLSGEVQYVGVDLAHGGFRPAASCAEWFTRLRADPHDYVVLSKSPVAANQSPTRELAWMLRAPGAQLTFRSGNTAVFRLDAPPSPSWCSGHRPAANVASSLHAQRVRFAHGRAPSGFPARRAHAFLVQ